MPYKYLLSFFILISIFTSGCLSNQQNQMNKSQSKPPVSIYDKKWILVNTDQSPYTAFVNFKEDGKVSGFSGCNTFFSKATISENDISANLITIGPLASTRKMCAKAMQFETNVISNLSNVTHYKIDTIDNIETLYLYQNQTEMLIFTYK
jgi:heat shock protein HslJ